MNNNESKNPTVLKFEFPQVVNEAILPLAKSIGITLSHGWEGLTMGLETWYGKKKIEHDQNLFLYKDEIQKNMSAIPEENLQEPKMNILGPSLEASKFYFEEPQYREMFAKLISASFDKQKNEIIHPYFVDAIKQLKPIDAYFLSLFKKNLSLPVVSYVYKLNNQKGSSTAYPYVYLEENKRQSPDYFSSSIVNIQRLSFISVDFTKWILDDSKYDVFRKDPVFYSLKNVTTESFRANPNAHYKDFDLIKGVMTLTPLGIDFLNICF